MRSLRLMTVAKSRFHVLDAHEKPDVFQRVVDPRPDGGIFPESPKLGQDQLQIKILVDPCDVPQAGSGV